MVASASNPILSFLTWSTVKCFCYQPQRQLVFPTKRRDRIHK